MRILVGLADLEFLLVCPCTPGTLGVFLGMLFLLLLLVFECLPGAWFFAFPCFAFRTF